MRAVGSNEALVLEDLVGAGCAVLSPALLMQLVQAKEPRARDVRERMRACV